MQALSNRMLGILVHLHGPSFAVASISGVKTIVKSISLVIPSFGGHLQRLLVFTSLSKDWLFFVGSAVVTIMPTYLLDVSTTKSVLLFLAGLCIISPSI